MKFYKRALLSVIRRKGKTIILLVLVFILGNIMAYGVSINQATKNIDNNLKKSFGGYVMVNLDYTALEKAYQDGDEKIYQDYEKLSLGTVKQIGESSYVNYYDYNMSHGYYLGDLQQYKSDSESSIYSYGSPTSTAIGVEYAPIMDATEGKIEIVDGRTFTEDEITNGKYVAVVSKEFAELNNLFVGDTFKVENRVVEYTNDGTESTYASQDVVLEIIGLFELDTSSYHSENTEDQDWMNYQLQEAYNSMYVPNATNINELKFTYEKYAELYPEDYSGMDESDWTSYYTPIYVLNNPEDTTAFVEEVEGLIPEYYTLQYSTDSYDQISTSITQMSGISKTILIGSIVATIVILSLVVILFLRDRRHEFGIYMALGESKAKLLLQILIEVMSVAFIAISLSLFSGNMIAKSLSKNMLQNQLEKNADDSYGSMYYSAGSAQSYLSEVSSEDVLAAYDIELGLNYVAMIYAIGLSTALVSTVVPMIYTTRLKPKKILM